MSDYMSTNMLQTAFELIKVVASGVSIQDQIDEAESRLHIHFNKKELIDANSELLQLLQQIEAEAGSHLKPFAELLELYFHRITIGGRDYESLNLFLFLTEHPADRLNFQDFTSYTDYLADLTEEKRYRLFLSKINSYNHSYLRGTEQDDQADTALPVDGISALDVITAIMEMDIPVEIRWKIQDIFVHWKSHLKNALPLLDCAYQLLSEYAPQLECYAQNFISYWTDKISATGGIVPFVEQLVPLVNVPDNPLGYKVGISFFSPFELSFFADLPADNKVPSSPYEITIGILYGDHLPPRNPYFPDTNDDSETYLNALKLLGDRRRFEIMSYLSQKPAYAGELVKYSGLTAATVSHHMSQLAEASLIRLEKIDTKIYYSVNKEMLEKCLDYYRRKLIGP